MIDFVRRRAKENNIQSALTYQGKLEQVGSEVELDLTSCLKSMLGQLDKSDAKILEEIDLNGMSQKDYALSQGMKYSMLKSRVQRARAKLKTRLLTCCRFALDSRGIPFELTEGSPCGCDKGNSN